MKTINILAIILSSFLFLSSCILEDDNSGGVTIDFASETDSDRDDTKSSKYKCEEDNECVDVCEDVYDPDGDDRNIGKVDTCVELKYNTAIQFEDMLEILEEPYESSLRNVSSKAFAEFLDVSVEPWVETMKSVSESEAESLLIWIAKERGISQAIIDAYDEYEKDYSLYEGVYELFKEVGDGSSCSDLCDAFTDNIDKTVSFEQIVADKNNVSAMCIMSRVWEEENCLNDTCVESVVITHAYSPTRPINFCR